MQGSAALPCLARERGCTRRPAYNVLAGLRTPTGRLRTRAVSLTHGPPRAQGTRDARAARVPAQRVPAAPARPAAGRICGRAGAARLCECGVDCRAECSTLARRPSRVCASCLKSTGPVPGLACRGGAGAVPDAAARAQVRIDAMDFNVSAPHMHATCLEALDLQPGHAFLDIGCGCGLVTAAAAFLARLGPRAGAGYIAAVRTSSGAVPQRPRRAGRPPARSAGCDRARLACLANKACDWASAVSCVCRRKHARL